MNPRSPIGEVDAFYDAFIGELDLTKPQLEGSE